MPFERDGLVRKTWWCPKWYWPFAVCSGIRTVHQWCYNFSWVKRTGYVLGIYHEGCEAGQLFTWVEPGFGIGTLDTFVPLGEMSFESPRTSNGKCDSSNTGLAAFPLTADQQQADWRYCRRCHAMFFDGYPDKGVCPADHIELRVVARPSDVLIAGRDLLVAAFVGTQLHIRIFDADGKMVVDKTEHELVCGEKLEDLKRLLTGVSDHSPLSRESKQRIIRDAASIAGHVLAPAGGGHVASGFNFVLPHDAAESQWAQNDWRYCQKRHTMFFDGYSAKGACSAGGGHTAAGYNFVLPHDISETEQAQKDWRYCHKCHSMFFDGYSGKGVCPAGGGHAAAGFGFVLSHA